VKEQPRDFLMESYLSAFRPAEYFHLPQPSPVRNAVQIPSPPSVRWLADARGFARSSEWTIRVLITEEHVVSDRRNELRLPTHKEVRVIVVQGGSFALGTLHDISLEGARIELLFPLQPRQKIDLIFDDHEQRFRCTVRWCCKNEIGVSFDLPVRLVPTADIAFLN
jgi:hypothetical protein